MNQDEPDVGRVKMWCFIDLAIFWVLGGVILAMYHRVDSDGEPTQFTQLWEPASGNWFILVPGAVFVLLAIGFRVFERPRAFFQRRAGASEEAKRAPGK